MAWTAKPASGVYSLDTGSAYKPAHLWMFDESGGTNANDIGTGTALDMALQNADMWGSDAELGAFITCAFATSRYALSATGTLAANNALLVAVYKSTSATNPSANEAVFSLANSTDNAYGRGAIRFDTNTSFSRPSAYYHDGTNIPGAHMGSGDYYDNAWHMVAVKFQDDGIGVSIDGGAWTASSPTLVFPGVTGNPNRYGVGAVAFGTPTALFNGSVAAAWVYQDGTYAGWDNTFIAALYNGGDPWSMFLTITRTKVKLLAPAAAASAADIEGVVLNAARDTVIGEFTGQAFDASLDGDGYAVLQIDCTDITPDGSTLTTSDAPLVIAYNTDFSTDLAAATVIEE